MTRQDKDLLTFIIRAFARTVAILIAVSITVLILIHFNRFD
jgi:hypothetical protein